MWTVFKVFIKFATILFLLLFRFFGHEACVILVPRPEIEATTPALEGQVLIPEPPGTSQFPHKVNNYLI